MSILLLSLLSLLRVPGREAGEHHALDVGPAEDLRHYNIYIYIYIYRERERYVYMCTYIYIYIYM